ncbi:lupus La protein isoform X2 [Stigmatopora argus]
MSEEMSPIELKVVRQVEYYFGDHNLPRDRFLKEQLKLDDGWVPLETMLKFNRLKSLTSDAEIIVSALQKSNSGLLEINEDKTKIRRSPEKPLPEINDEYKDAVKHKSVYMKGFPLATTLDEIQEWLNAKGNVENILMRRNMERQFKGSVFVCFDTQESSKEFLERSDIKTFKENEMLVLSREAYHAKKAEERKQHKAETKAKVKQDKEQQEKHVEKKDMDQLLEEHSGALLMFSGELENVSREDFHEVFSGHGKIKWIDFTRGAKEGTLLFGGNAKEAFEKAKEANDGELKVKNNDVAWKLLDGEEEKDALKKIIAAQQESLSQRKGRGGRGRSGGRGGRGGRRGKGGRDQGKTEYQGKKTKFDSDDEEAPPAKVAKTENGS